MYAISYLRGRLESVDLLELVESQEPVDVLELMDNPEQWESLDQPAGTAHLDNPDLAVRQVPVVPEEKLDHAAAPVVLVSVVLTVRLDLLGRPGGLVNRDPAALLERQESADQLDKLDRLEKAAHVVSCSFKIFLNKVSSCKKCCNIYISILVGLLPYFTIFLNHVSRQCINPDYSYAEPRACK